LDAYGRRSVAQAHGFRNETSPHRKKVEPHGLIDPITNNRFKAPEGEGEMTMPRPQQWTQAEVHQLRMLAKKKVSADSVAKLLGRYVGSVKIKARELNLILSRRVKAKGK
jgi:hypothetical protein